MVAGNTGLGLSFIDLLAIQCIEIKTGEISGDTIFIICLYQTFGQGFAQGHFPSEYFSPVFVADCHGYSGILPT